MKTRDVRPKVDPDSFVSYPPPVLDSVHRHKISGVRVRIIGKVGLSAMYGRVLDGPRAGTTLVVNGYQIHRNYTESE